MPLRLTIWSKGIHFLLILLLVYTLYNNNIYTLSTHTLPGEATVTVSGIERRLLASKHGVEVSN